jgi:polyhydroxyalkanoate synthesis regulator phasin
VQSLVASGVITQQEAATFSQQQLEFLARKRGGTPSAAPAAAAGNAGGSAYDTAVGNDAIQEYLAKGLVTQQEAKSFSLQQLEFLARKRTTVRA